MFEITRNGKGMFSTGNIKPLNIIVGKNKPIIEISIAVCCEFAIDDISKPNDKQVMVNKILSPPNNNRLPFIGTPSTKTLSNKMLVMLMMDSSRYGMAFATTIFIGCMGDTSIISMVPVSFSRTMVMAVIMVHTSIKTIAITPGTKL